MQLQWLNSPLGQDLLRAEQGLMRNIAEGVFGEYGVQLGQWGESDSFLRYVRTQRKGLLVDRPVAGASLCSALDTLAIESDSVDLLLLPHTLDVCEHPQATLREANRVLRSDGQLIIFSFKPGGIWGLKRLRPGASYPPGSRRLVAERHLADWLELLDLRVLTRQRYFFRLPRKSVSRESDVWERWGERFWPELGACYLLRAQKRLRTITPIRAPWRQSSKVVASLVKPTARVARERIRRGLDVVREGVDE